jgi:hypothetical protein
MLWKGHTRNGVTTLPREPCSVYSSPPIPARTPCPCAPPAVPLPGRPWRTPGRCAGGAGALDPPTTGRQAGAGSRTVCGPANPLAPAPPRSLGAGAARRRLGGCAGAVVFPRRDSAFAFVPVVVRDGFLHAGWGGVVGCWSLGRPCIFSRCGRGFSFFPCFPLANPPGKIHLSGAPRTLAEPRGRGVVWRLAWEGFLLCARLRPWHFCARAVGCHFVTRHHGDWRFSRCAIL